MNILITGGSGFLGTALTKALKQNTAALSTTALITVTWVSRHVRHSDQTLADAVISYDELVGSSMSFDIIINLAGSGIADSRWSAQRKQELLASRIEPTQAILDYIAQVSTKPKLLISGSAIGWYGIQDTHDAHALSEISTARPDFAHELCQQWEQLAQEAKAYGVAVTIIRTGVVIDPSGGMLTRLLTPFKLGLGGQLGDGKQVMSWISRHDWVRAVLWIIDSHHKGQSQPVYNLTTPTPVTNAVFTKALGEYLHRPTWLGVPDFVLKILLGKMSTLLLDGQWVVPAALLAEGFAFEHLTLDEALADGRYQDCRIRTVQ